MGEGRVVIRPQLRWKALGGLACAFALSPIVVIGATPQAGGRGGAAAYWAVSSLLMCVMQWLAWDLAGAVRADGRRVRLNSLELATRSDIAEMRSQGRSVTLFDAGGLPLGSMSLAFYGEGAGPRLAAFLGMEVRSTGGSAARRRRGDEDRALLRVTPGRRYTALRVMAAVLTLPELICGVAFYAIFRTGASSGHPAQMLPLWDLVYQEAWLVILAASVATLLLTVAPRLALLVTGATFEVARGRTVTVWPRSDLAGVVSRRGWVVLTGRSGPLAWFRDGLFSDAGLDRLRTLIGAP
jgi:hypothetical protein